MVIGIDIRVLGNPIKSGIEEYAENLIPSLIREGRDYKFKLFYSSWKNKLRNYEWLKEPNVELHKFKYPNNLLFTSSKIFKAPRLDRMIGGADAFFFPHIFLSSLSPACKRVTTFHDLSYVHYPEFFTARKRIWHNIQMVPEWQAKFSDKIISVSESTKKDLINFYHIDPARIEVIYSGVGNVAKKTDEEISNFKKEKKLPERYLLFLGKIEPRKNVKNLIKAFCNLKNNPRYRNVGLVICGSKGWLCEDVYEKISLSKLKEQIYLTDYVNKEEKRKYYQGASIFIYPTFFEGFGFPPLEAIQYGVPVISSRNSSIPEVLKDSAILIDPYDVQQLEMWISKLLDDKHLGEVLVKKGIETTSIFTWKNSATRTLNAIIGA